MMLNYESSFFLIQVMSSSVVVSFPAFAGDELSSRRDRRYESTIFQNPSFLLRISLNEFFAPVRLEANFERFIG